jgi:hypothetical protein
MSAVAAVDVTSHHYKKRAIAAQARFVLQRGETSALATMDAPPAKHPEGLL